MSKLAPIILFCFNRVDHLSQTVKALQKNELAQESELFIFCDGPRNQAELEKVKKVHEFIDEISGFKEIHIKKQKLNLGLANSVISAVSKIVNKYGKAIILEDDIVTSKSFLKFMNESLDFYENDKKVSVVTGFNYHNFKKPKNFNNDIFFLKGRNCSWGWATWKDRWQNIDFEIKDFDKIKNDKKRQKEFNKAGANLFDMLKDQYQGKVDTWDIQLAFHMFKNDLHTVFPVKTFVKNIGFDNSGIHCHKSEDIANFDLRDNKSWSLKVLKDIKNNDFATSEYVKLASGNKTFTKKLFSKKRLYKLKYIALGFLLAMAINFFI